MCPGPGTAQQGQNGGQVEGGPETGAEDGRHGGHRGGCGAEQQLLGDIFMDTRQLLGGGVIHGVVNMAALTHSRDQRRGIRFYRDCTQVLTSTRWHLSIDYCNQINIYKSLNVIQKMGTRDSSV